MSGEHAEVEAVELYLLSTPIPYGMQVYTSDDPAQRNVRLSTTIRFSVERTVAYQTFANAPASGIVEATVESARLRIADDMLEWLGKHAPDRVGRWISGKVRS